MGQLCTGPLEDGSPGSCLPSQIQCFSSLAYFLLVTEQLVIPLDYPEKCCSNLLPYSPGMCGLCLAFPYPNPERDS